MQVQGYARPGRQSPLPLPSGPPVSAGDRWYDLTIAAHCAVDAAGASVPRQSEMQRRGALQHQHREIDFPR